MKDALLMDKVLVLDGRQRSSLAVVRSLGRQGIFIAVGDEQQPCLSSRSKYCRETFKYISPARSPLGFIEELLSWLRTHEYDMIIPTTDITCYLVAEHKEEISRYTRVPIVGGHLFKMASDKAEVLKLCIQKGIPTPKSCLPNCIDDVIKMSAEITYPAVIKPRRSKFLIDSNWVETGVDYAESADDLVKIFEKSSPSLPLPIIQERIPGPGIGAFVLMNNGESKAVFFHRRIREKPLSGGVSTLRESIAVDQTTMDYSIKLLEALDWYGVAMVEFKLDSRDNLPKIMEINGRFWGSLQLAVDSGIDFPFMLYKMAMDGDIEPATGYKVGIKSRWLMGDLDHLLIRLFHSDAKLKLPKGFPGRLRTFIDFMKFYQRDQIYEINRWDDMKPFLFELKDYIRQTIKDIGSKISG
jgi:predicted ATP-grasp superfamily ATP-dependent carboligase